MKISLPGKTDAAKQLAQLCGWNEPDVSESRVEVVIRKL